MTPFDYTTTDPMAIVVQDYTTKTSCLRSEISVIISTYNQPAWLEKVLWGYQMQSERQFEVVISDDGSGAQTRELLERLAPEMDYPIRHVWQADHGFRKCRIVNQGIVNTQSDYMLVTDGDCVPRADFLAQHLKFRRPGYFLSGGAVRLPMELSQFISPDNIVTGACFDCRWLNENGLKGSFRNNKLTTSTGWATFLNAVTPAGATWNGNNASGWKKDILLVGGHDERMEYGGEDREMGERMMNRGIKGRQIRYSAVLLHLDHGRGYIHPEADQRNRAIRKQTAQRRSVWTPYGISSNKSDESTQPNGNSENQ